MIHSGGRGFCRVLAFCLTCVLMLSACYVPAYGLDVWAETALNLFWTDEVGKIRIYPMTPVVMEGQRAYWVQADADAQGQTLYLEALCPDPAYSFYFLDDMGGHEAALTWYPEMDAATLDQGYAHYLWYSVDGVQADQPILLYVSSIPQPEEAPFVSYPVQVEVSYVTEDGTVLDTQSAECWAGESTPVWAGSRRTQGYTLISPDVVEVYVDEAGQASTDVVTFVYRANATPEPTEAPTATPVTEVTVPVVYYHVNGTQLDFS